MNNDNGLIKYIRKSLKVSQQAFCKQIGITQAYLSQIENDKIKVISEHIVDRAKLCLIKSEVEKRRIVAS